MTKTANLAQAGGAAARSALYRFLAFAFHEPDEPTLRFLASEALFADVRRAVEGVSGLPRGLDEGVAAIFHLIRSGGLSKPAYTAVFGHTVAGPATPYEAEYGSKGDLDQIHTLSDLCGTYRAFGLSVSEVEHERSDHVTVQCEFMSFLAYKEAIARESGNQMGVNVVEDAERLFLVRHVGRFGPAFARRLEGVDPDGFWGRAARLLAALLEADARRLGVTLGPPTLSVRERDPEQDDGCTACRATGASGAAAGPGVSV